MIKTKETENCAPQVIGRWSSQSLIKLDWFSVKGEHLPFTCFENKIQNNFDWVNHLNLRTQHIVKVLILFVWECEDRIRDELWSVANMKLNTGFYRQKRQWNEN